LPDLPISPLDAAFAIGVAFLGAAVQSSVGFGLALVAAPLLLLIHPAFIPGPLLTASLALTILVAHRERRSIDFLGVKYAIAGRVFGTVPAALLISAISTAVFDVVFGSIVIFAVALSALGLSVTPNRGYTFTAGALSGFMGTISSIGGPPVALLYQNAEGPRFRATLSGFFFIGVLLSLIALALVGKLGLQELLLGAILVPGILLGFSVSGLVVRWVDRKGVRPAVLAISFGSAMVVLWRAFSG
jgi:uncharacterized membrane protein YfcA